MDGSIPDAMSFPCVGSRRDPADSGLWDCACSSMYISSSLVVHMALSPCQVDQSRLHLVCHQWKLFMKPWKLTWLSLSFLRWLCPSPLLETFCLSAYRWWCPDTGSDWAHHNLKRCRLGWGILETFIVLLSEQGDGGAVKIPSAQMIHLVMVYYIVIICYWLHHLVNLVMVSPT